MDRYYLLRMATVRKHETFYPMLRLAALAWQQWSKCFLGDMIFSKVTRQVVMAAFKYACLALPPMSSSLLNHNARLPLLQGLQGIYLDIKHFGGMKKANTGAKGIPMAAT